jgi:hypothetical protein
LGAEHEAGGPFEQKVSEWRVAPKLTWPVVFLLRLGHPERATQHRPVGDGTADVDGARRFLPAVRAAEPRAIAGKSSPIAAAEAVRSLTPYFDRATM